MRLRGASASALQVKTVAKVHSLELAEAEKEKMEKNEEARRAKFEWMRSEIEKNKKEKEAKQKKEEEKKMAEEKKLLKEMKKVSMDLKNVSKEIKKSGKLVVKKSAKLGRIEAAPKEKIVPTVEAPAVPVAVYRSRAEVEGKIEAAIETVPSIEEAIVAVPSIEKKKKKKEEVVSSIENKQKKEEDVVPSIEAPAVPVTAEVEAERSESYQSRPCTNVRKMKELDGTKESGLDILRKQAEARRAHSEWVRTEIEKKRKKEEEERKKEEEQKLEEERKLMKEIEEDLKSLSKEVRKAKKLVVMKPSRREAILVSVMKKWSLESEPGSPTGVLQERARFGWSGSSNSSCGGSSAGYESGF